MRLSKPRVELINDLLMPDCVLLHRDRDRLSDKHRREFVSGTVVIKLVRGKEVLIKKHSWMPAKALLEAGFIEFVKDKEPHGKIYRITQKALAIKEPTKKRAVKPKKKRPLYMADIKEFAASCGCTIKQNRTHLWYELTRVDGTKLKNPYIAYNTKGQPVSKQSDLTDQEWLDLIRLQSEWEPEQECETKQPEQEQLNTSS